MEGTNKGTEKCFIKRKLEFKDYENCLKATQLENKINQLEKQKVNTESLRENLNEFIKNNKLILKTQQRFKSERHNVFTEEIKKIALSPNDDKRIQSIQFSSIQVNQFSRNVCICNEQGFNK